jgi:hypothetical protein
LTIALSAAVTSLVPSDMAPPEELCSVYSKVHSTASSDSGFFALVTQLVELARGWQPASDDAQFAGQVMDLLDAKVREHFAFVLNYSIYHMKHRA